MMSASGQRLGVVRLAPSIKSTDWSSEKPFTLAADWITTWGIESFAATTLAMSVTVPEPTLTSPFGSPRRVRSTALATVSSSATTSTPDDFAVTMVTSTR